MSADGRLEVGAAADFDDGDVAVVDVDGVEVGVLHVDGEFRAYRNYCPHQGGPVCEGKLSQRLAGRFVGAGERVERSLSDQTILSCPLHGWSFDVTTGANIADGSIRLAAYDVVVEDGVVYVEK